MEQFFILAGPCVLEDKETALQIGRHVKSVCDKLGFKYVFKASYRKANRTRMDSFQGIGDEAALQIIAEIGQELGVETITDIHLPEEAALAAKYVDNLQIPAFLCRQTDLLVAAGNTGKQINLKKGQFVSHEAMRFALDKIRSTGNEKIWLCERGNSFGYSDLIVDATSMPRLRNLGVPAVMDCTHSVQKPNQTAGVTGGDPSMIEAMALMAAATGASGLFLETHPEPSVAKSDSQSMLKLSEIEGILTKVKAIRSALNA